MKNNKHKFDWYGASAVIICAIGAAVAIIAVNIIIKSWAGSGF